MILFYLVGAAWMYLLPWKNGKNEKLQIGVLECIGWGELLLGAFFLVASFLPLHRGMGLQELTTWSIRVGIAIGVIALIILRGHVVEPVLRSGKALTEGFRQHTLLEVVLVIASVLAIIGSATVILPHAMDSTVESVSFMQMSDSLYLSDPYGWKLVEPLTVNHSPVLVLYGVAATMCHQTALVFVQHTLPIYLLVGILGIYQFAARLLFTEVRSRKLFLLFLLVMAYLEVLGVDNITTGILENPWNGQTLLVAAVIPAAFCCGYAWMEKFQWQVILAMGALLVTGQLVAAKGFAPVGLSMGVAVVLSLILRRARHA